MCIQKPSDWLLNTERNENISLFVLQSVRKTGHQPPPLPHDLTLIIPFQFYLLTFSGSQFFHGSAQSPWASGPQPAPLRFLRGLCVFCNSRLKWFLRPVTLFSGQLCPCSGRVINGHGVSGCSFASSILRKLGGISLLAFSCIFKVKEPSGNLGAIIQ